MDNELLQAIGQIVRSEIQPVKDQLQGLEGRFDSLEKRFDGLEVRMDGLEERFDGLEERFDGLEKRFDGLEVRVGGLENEVRKINITLDNEIKPNINLLADGHMGIIRRLDNIEEKVSEIDEIKDTVSVLKMVTFKNNS